MHRRIFMVLITERCSYDIVIAISPESRDPLVPGEAPGLVAAKPGLVDQIGMGRVARRSADTAHARVLWRYAWAWMRDGCCRGLKAQLRAASRETDDPRTRARCVAILPVRWTRSGIRALATGIRENCPIV